MLPLGELEQEGHACFPRGVRTGGTCVFPHGSWDMCVSPGELEQEGRVCFPREVRT